MRGDISVRGFAQNLRRRQAASATRVVAGEPMHSLGTPTAGEADVNTYVLVAADSPIIATHAFGGVAQEDSYPRPTGTVVAAWITCACPVPSLGRMEARALIVGEVDTLTELVAVLGDTTLFDYNATGGTDGGEQYTIISDATANTSGLTIVDGTPAKSLLEVVIDGRAYRNAVS